MNYKFSLITILIREKRYFMPIQLYECGLL